jgi:hypothetical protein
MLSVGKSLVSRMGARVLRRTNVRPPSVPCYTTLTAAGSAVGTAVDDALINKPVATGGYYPAVQYSTAHKALPEETMYIFDGTAMLFAAYFASGGTNASNSLYTINKNGSSYFVANDDSGVFGGAKLSDDLNRRIIGSMTDEQVRIMINSLDESDRKVARTAVKEINSSAPVSAEDRAKLQLRCGPLVALLLQFARFIRDVQPKYVAVAFDAGRTTFRTKLYPLYKKHRQPVSVNAEKCADWSAEFGGT